MQDSLLEGGLPLQDLRAVFFKKWLKRAFELRGEEAVLHESLPPHLQALLKGKRLLLWKELLVEFGYPDKAIVDDIVSGFKLTGWAESTGVFKPCVRPPKYTVDHLRGSSIGLCQAVLSKVLTGADEQLEQKTWKLTQEEVEKGWIVPTTNSDLDQCFLAHRFGIVQGEKIRLRQLFVGGPKRDVWVDRKAGRGAGGRSNLHPGSGIGF